MSDYLEAYNHALGTVCHSPSEPMQSVESRVAFEARMIMGSWESKRKEVENVAVE